MMQNSKKVIYTRVDPSVSKEHRNFYNHPVKKAFIKYLAYEGWFDNVLNDEEIAHAKEGQLPQDLEVHHIFPLSGSDSNEVNAFPNLCVIHKTTHIYINRKIFRPQLKDVEKMAIGEKREITIPLFDPVDITGIVKHRAALLKQSSKKHYPEGKIAYKNQRSL